jgi:hypothetical protein
MSPRAFVVAAFVVCAWTFLAAGLWACTTPQPPPLDLESRWRREPNDQALLELIEGELEQQADPDAPAAVRLRFLRALLWRDCCGAERAREASAELRVLAVVGQGTMWGRLAREFAEEIGRSDVLRQAVMQAGAEVQGVEQQLAALAARLVLSQKEGLELETALVGLREERVQALRRQRELEEQLVAQQARSAELEEELAALKRIDMQRRP